MPSISMKLFSQVLSIVILGSIKMVVKIYH
jgi:hypothetical protein